VTPGADRFDDQSFWLVLERYVSGEATAADSVAVEAWRNANPIAERVLRDLERIRRVTAEAPPERDLEVMWSNAASALGIHAASDGPVGPVEHIARPPTRTRHAHAPSRSRVGRGWHSRSSGLWAALVISAAVLVGWRIVSSSGPGRTADVVKQPIEREYRTARAQRATVRLSDGSEVTLNADSRIRVPPQYGKRRRDLYLEGEAYFVVVHDTSAPFTVHTTRGIVHDLGTKFGVRAYADGPRQLEVVVAEGAVSVGGVAGRDSLVIRAAEAGYVAADGQLRVQLDVDASTRLGWIEGRLEFKNVPLGEALRVMARWYDADIRAGDEQLAAYPITATLTGERFTDAVAAVARVVDARVVDRKGGEEFVLVRKASRD
jgi:transmembrane sensor